MMTRYPNVYVLDVMSDDHPGIVAAVSDAVESLGGNIDSCSQTVLGGYFTLIMIVSLPDPIETDRLASRVRLAGAASSEFQVMVRSVLPAKRLSPDGQFDRFVISSLRQGSAGNRPPLQPIPGRQGHQHHRSLRRPPR